MLNVRNCSDISMARSLWKRYWPKGCLFDFWEVRNCFQRAYDRPPHFIVAEKNGRFAGMMALSWIEEEQYFGHFPGEVWHGKTWLEQNKIVAHSDDAARALLASMPDPVRIRYLLPPDRFSGPGEEPVMDEIGYLFYPEQHGCSFDSYWSRFPGKSRKKIRNECNRLERHGISFRHDCLADMDRMFRMNLDNFGSLSYFADPRFLQAFEHLVQWLDATDLLRITTVLVGGQVAAVDLSAVVDGRVTVLAGGTDPEFPGVAKVINLHHLRWACEKRMKEVDFLCGDFNWKERFRLVPRPLYQWVKNRESEPLQDAGVLRRTARVSG